jgi:hypothetical protein
MYNMYPIFEALSGNEAYRKTLNKNCHQTVKLLESGYPWYPLSPNSVKDELGHALNGYYDFELPTVNDWYAQRDEWVFDMQETVI